MRDHTETQDEQHPPRWNYPKDWTPFYIRELAVGGLANGVFKEPRRAGRGLPLINVGDLYAQFGIDTNLIDRFDATPTERRRYSVHPGDIFFTRSSLNLSGIAHCNIVKDIHEPVIFECHLMRARLDPAIAASIFVAHWCRSPPARSFLMSRAKQVTMTTIAQPDVGAMLLPLPPLPEQRQIAEVLDTIDDAIRKTEQLIQKLKQMKQGLLHDLLTRGIDENGELRDPDRHPEQFQDSPLGRIPKQWATVPFRVLCESSAFGPRFPGDCYAEDGKIATLRTTDMDDEGNIDLSTMPRASISPSDFARHLLRVDDLVISRSGTCGIAGVFPGHSIDVVPGAFLIRFRMHQRVQAAFFRLYFNSAVGRPGLSRLAVGGVQQNIKGTDVLALFVPHLSMEEASCIVEILHRSEINLQSELQANAKLRLLKQGLMDDLLTGRVRTTVLDGVGA